MTKGGANALTTAGLNSAGQRVRPLSRDGEVPDGLPSFAGSLAAPAQAASETGES